MSRRRASNKRKGNAELFPSSDIEEEDECKEDKRPKHEPGAVDASSSSAAATAPAAASSSPPAAAASSSSTAAPSATTAATSHPRDEVEDVVCSACHEAFDCADESARLPRTLPCGHPMCSGCIRQSLGLTPGSVLCPHEHGQSKISVPAGVAAAAVSTVEGWLRLLPPRADLIAAIRNQQLAMTQLGQQGARCSRPGCESAVTHYCSKCRDLCSDHERSRHAALPSHKVVTMLIAQKESFLRDQSQSEVAEAASAIRVRIQALLLQQQQTTQLAEAEVKQVEALLLAKKNALQTNVQALSSLQQTVDWMRAADDDTVIEVHAELPPIAAAWTKHDSTVFNELPDDRVAALQTFLGPHRLLSKAKLIYRASRDGFKAENWWRQCGGKASLLTIVRVKGDGFVFGSFTSFQWPAECPKDLTIVDPSGTTFLFSLVNAHNRAIKLKLGHNEYATKAAGQGFSGSGPLFGRDLGLMCDRLSADPPRGNWTGPCSFEFDRVADGGKPIAYDKTLLAGDNGQSGIIVSFAAAEIESWQL